MRRIGGGLVEDGLELYEQWSGRMALITNCASAANFKAAETIEWRGADGYVWGNIADDHHPRWVLGY